MTQKSDHAFLKLWNLIFLLLAICRKDYHRHVLQWLLDLILLTIENQFLIENHLLVIYKTYSLF